MHSYLWLDYKNIQTPGLLTDHLQQLLFQKKFENRLYHHPLIILCIGTPNIPGDSLGPLVGSLLRNRTEYKIFGTMKQPVHALNIKNTIKIIKQEYPNSIIIAIDAAIGHKEQNGFLAVAQRSLKPGLGLGKKLPAIGHIQITGVFDNIYAPGAQKQMAGYSLCIAKSLTSLEFLYTSFKKQTLS